MRFRGLVISLLLINTLVLAATIFLCVMRTAGLPWYGLTEFVPKLGDPRWTYLIGSLLFLESILLFALFGVKAAFGLAAAFCVLVAMLSPVPGRVDEGSHLAFIEHVSQHSRVPSIRDPLPWDVQAMRWGVYPNPVSKSALSKTYPEKTLSGTVTVAFHPPLYYMVMAMWYPLLPANLVKKTRGLRLLGGILLLVAAFFLQRTLALLSETANKNGNPDTNNFLQFSVISLICLNPGIVYRMTMLGNVQAGFVLAAMTTYWLCRMMTRGPERRRDVAVLGILGGLLALSYYYSIVLLGVIALWMLLTRRFKGLFLYGTIVVLLTSPWLLHNYLTYGTINAGEVARRYATELGVVMSPYGLQDAWRMLITGLSRLLLPQESYLYASSMLPETEGLAHYLAWGLLATAVVCAATSVFRGQLVSARKAARLDFLLIAAGIVAGTIATLLLVAYYSQLGLPIRYGYLMLPSLGIVSFAVLLKLPKTVQTVIASCMVFFVAVSSVDATGINIRYSDLIARAFQQIYRTCWLEIEPDERPNLVELGPSSFTQSFRADYDYLSGISLFLCPGTARTGPLYWLRLSDDRGKILREVSFRLSDSKDCSYHDILFDPISHARGRTFLFSLSNRESTNDRSGLLPLSKAGAYAYGSAQVDGKPIREDAVFDTMFCYDVWSTAVPTRDREGPSCPPRLSRRHSWSNFGLKPSTTENVGPILAERFQQWFVAYSDSLCGIRFLVNTFCRRSVSPYILQLFDAQGVMIRQVEIDGRKMGDWRHVEVRFEPVPDSAGKRFGFTVIPRESILERPITLPLAVPGSYPEGHVEIDGTRINRNVVFDAVFQRRFHEKFQRAIKAHSAK